MIRRLQLILLSMLLLLAGGCTYIFADDLDVVAIQWEMKQEYATSVRRFFADAEAAIEKGLEQREHDSALVIFPEYTSVFMSLDRFAPVIEEYESVLEAWQVVSKSEGYRSISDLFRKNSYHTYRMLERWKALARQYDCYLVPGSFFVYDHGLQEVVNRLVVISPEGTILYYQDKVFTTEFEQQILGLGSSAVRRADPIWIAGKKIAFTICRDTFFEKWEDRFGSVDLWVDIKANGVEFTKEQRKLFGQAVPERVENTDSSYGLTVCLTGSFLSLLWEGESSLVDSDRRVIKSSSCFDSFDIFTFSL